ncbi:MAG TPA: four-carbon acid sugar kinase family protein [Puia sp.]|jgi:uncharacterized protein YgbK (DUF1537 family)|nr:four-carbon acid sugar kinase family protein [Puia sp.]
MIAVIADDLTGAAELGGIGVRYGLRTEIRTSAGTHTDADLLVIAGDSRSKNEREAVEEMTGITRGLRLLQPGWVYKKTDSVLRGHVVAELEAHMQALGRHLALLVPANPSLGRTIHDGHYFLNGLPVHLSSFATDPEFPVTSSDIQDVLHARERPVFIRKAADVLPERGIIVGEVHDKSNLQLWARRLPQQALPAGGAEFFSTLLELRLGRKPSGSSQPFVPGAPVLFVSGSTFDSSRKLIREQFDGGGPVSYMPRSQDTDWAAGVIRLLKDEGKAIMAIDAAHRGHSALQLRQQMAEVVATVLKTSMPGELIIEGGSTAFAILEKQGWESLLPEQELGPGTIRMRVPQTPGLFITVKPGSYRWPGSIRY